jgi:hypothetical protein
MIITSPAGLPVKFFDLEIEGFFAIGILFFDQGLFKNPSWIPHRDDYIELFGGHRLN